MSTPKTIDQERRYTVGWRLRRDGKPCPDSQYEGIGWLDADAAIRCDRPIEWSRGTDGKVVQAFDAGGGST